MRQKLVLVSLLCCVLSATSLIVRAQDVATQDGAGAPDPTPRLPLLLYGTGFFVTRDGYVLTSSHIVDGCLNVAVKESEEKYTDANVVAQEKDVGLALLKIKSSATAPAAFRTLPPRTGEPIVTYTYSHFLDALAAGNATWGKISGLEPPADGDRVQIAMPIRPANNGGPVLDTGGNVIGIIDTKRATSDASPRLSYAMLGITAANFLERQGISYQTAAPTLALTPSDLLERIKAVTVVIQCRTNL